MNRLNVKSELKNLDGCMDFIKENPTKFNLSSSVYNEALLLSEEAIVKIVENSFDDANLRVEINKDYNGTFLCISARGKEIDEMSSDATSLGHVNNVDEETESEIRKLIFKSYSDRVSYRFKNGRNEIKIKIGKVNLSLAIYTFLGIFLGLLAGQILFALNAFSLADSIKNNITIPFQNMFINLLNLLALPTMFLAVTHNISFYFTINTPSRIIKKLFFVFILTTIIAIFVGVVSFDIFSPGKFGLASDLLPRTTDNKIVSSLTKAITDMVPDNIFSPFAESNTVQVLFFSVICGIALVNIGDKSKSIVNIIDGVFQLFIKILAMAIHLSPLAAFASAFNITLRSEVAILIEICKMFFTVLFGIAVMVVIYCIMLLVNRISPIRFFKYYASRLIGIFKIGSSIDAVPYTIRTCRTDLGISSDILNYSIPMGAAFNLDANCIYQVVTFFFLANIVGMNLSFAEIMVLIITVVVVNIGSPNINGSGLIGTIIIISQMGIDPSAICITLGLDLFFSMFIGISNTIGDVISSLIVAKKENKLDKKMIF